MALVSLLIVILIGQSGAQGFFWCLGEENAALEYTTGQDCAQRTLQANQDILGVEAFTSSSQGDDCGPCLDISVTLDAASSRFHNLNNFSIEIESAVREHGSPLPKFVLALTVKHPPPYSPSISQTILFHRTVVLLS